MKEQSFKFTEGYARIIGSLEDKQAGILIKAMADYIFERKVYNGKDSTVKMVFPFVMKSIDDAKFFADQGRQGGLITQENRRRNNANRSSMSGIFADTTVAVGILKGIFSEHDNESSATEKKEKEQ